MLSRDVGGIQQAFLDYSKALDKQKVKVYNVTSIFAKVNLVASHQTIKLPNFGLWDIFSKLYLIFIILLLKPDVVIAHGNRAISFSKSIFSPVIIGVAHNYSTKYLRKCDYVIALTEQSYNRLIKENFLPEKLFIVPNMIDLPSIAMKSYRQPVIIGTMARFVKKKGVDVLIQALAKLEQKGLLFKAVIGGAGEEKSHLLNVVEQLGFKKEHVEFIGWIENKQQFFQDIDIFVLPSLDEPFGIIVLEAIAHKVPIIATKTEGPLDIIKDYSYLLCDINSSEDLVDKLTILINDYSLAQRYTDSNYVRLKNTYDIEVVSKKLYSYLQSTIVD